MNWPCDDIEPPPRGRNSVYQGTLPGQPKRKPAHVLALLIAGLIVLFLFITVLRSVDAYAQEPLGTQTGWAAHPALGIVIAYKVDDVQVLYAHPIIAQGPVPECKEGRVLVAECKGVRVLPGGIFLMTMDTEMPYLYVADPIATAKKVGAGRFERLVSATWKECE